MIESSASSGDQPFFLYLAFQAVHSPVQAPQEFIDLYPDVEDPVRQEYLGKAK